MQEKGNYLVCSYTSPPARPAHEKMAAEPDTIVVAFEGEENSGPEQSSCFADPAKDRGEFSTHGHWPQILG